MEVAYCTCLRSKTQGWVKRGDDWVCAKCHKPSRPWLEKIYIPRLLNEANMHRMQEDS